MNSHIGIADKKILLCVNSDIGRGNSIGWRFGKIADELAVQNIPFEIISRANYSRFPAKTPVYKNLLGRFLNGLRIYFLPFINYRSFEIQLFDFFSLRQIKKMESQGVEFCLAHFGEPCPKTMNFLKNRGIKILLDIPIGHYAYSQKLAKEGFKLDGRIELDRQLNEAIKLADLLVIPSEFVEETLVLAGFNNKKMKIVNFGADLPADFNENDIKKRAEDFKSGQRPLRFVFSGNVNWRKGINFLLAAWDKASLEKAELLVCGRVYKSIKKEIKKYKNKNVKFLGFAPAGQIMKKSDVFVLPTLLEGSSKAVFEALSHGLPAIVTPNSGSVVENSKDGFIIPIGDSDCLAEKMKYFYNNPEKISEMGLVAFSKAKNYTWNKYGRTAADLYKKFQ